MWVSLCLDLNSTTFPEGCLESVDCDKLLTIFSTPRKLARLGGAELAGPEAERLPPCSLLSLCFPAALYMAPVGALNSLGLRKEVD